MIQLPDIIKPSFIKEHPELAFIYGDNLLRKGNVPHRTIFGGYLNTFPVTTKRGPCNQSFRDFYYDHDLEEYKLIVANEILAILEIMPPPQLVIPLPGIGTWDDESRLDTVAPKLYAFLMDTFRSIKVEYESLSSR